MRNNLLCFFFQKNHSHNDKISFKKDTWLHYFLIKKVCPYLLTKSINVISAGQFIIDYVSIELKVLTFQKSLTTYGVNEWSMIFVLIRKEWLKFFWQNYEKVNKHLTNNSFRTKKNQEVHVEVLEEGNFGSVCCACFHLHVESLFLQNSDSLNIVFTCFRCTVRTLFEWCEWRYEYIKKTNMFLTLNN